MLQNLSLTHNLHLFIDGGSVIIPCRAFDYTFHYKPITITVQKDPDFCDEECRGVWELPILVLMLMGSDHINQS